MKHEGSYRPLRVGEMIKQVLIKVINQGKAQDIRIFNTNLTITEVKMSPDLKVANCYVMPFASRISPEELMDAFENSKSHLRMLVADRVKLKSVPELRFHYDGGQDNADEVDQILKKISVNK